MKRDKMFMLIGIFLVAVILSTIHHNNREGMSHRDEKERLKGEKYGESLIEKDIKHKEKTMQDSNHYSNDKYHNKWNDDENESDAEDESLNNHHKWNKEHNRKYDEENDDDYNDYGPGGEENIYGPGGEEWPSHHHKSHHHKPHHHKPHHHKPHHHKPHDHKSQYEESMNTMNDDSMYMLKSESIPPICPACPQTTACPKKKPCPPCPPCARCPDNNFECKKIPNYKGGDSSKFPTNIFGPGTNANSHGTDGTDSTDGTVNSSSPQPYLNSFAQF